MRLIHTDPEYGQMIMISHLSRSYDMIYNLNYVCLEQNKSVEDH